jgi:hypothetical protein
MVEDCSACTLMMSLPAFAKSATLCSGSTIILRGCREGCQKDNEAMIRQSRDVQAITSTCALGATKLDVVTRSE